MPDDPVGEEAFSVIRDAMAATDTVGISGLVLYRLEPRDRGMVSGPAQVYFGDIEREKLDPELMPLVAMLIESARSLGIPLW